MAVVSGGRTALDGAAQGVEQAYVHDERDGSCECQYRAREGGEKTSRLRGHQASDT